MVIYTSKGGRALPAVGETYALMAPVFLQGAGG